MMTVAMTEQTAHGRLGELWDAHAGDALRLAYLLTGQRELAEDLMQDAFIRISGRFRDLRDPGAFGSYLKRTVVNLANSSFRRRGVERGYLERYGPMLRDAIEGPDLGMRDQMWRALQRLPERQRAALVLRYYEDMTEEQIADMLGAARGTVKSLISRGLKGLRSRMGSEDR